MTILVDQNISQRTVAQLFTNEGLNWKHVKEVSLSRASDYEIWHFAVTSKIDCIMSADQDLFQILLQKGIPPKLIWLRIGNGSHQRVAELVNHNQQIIHSFLNNPKAECLENFP